MELRCEDDLQDETEVGILADRTYPLSYLCCVDFRWIRPRFPRWKNSAFESCALLRLDVTRIFPHIHSMPVTILYVNLLWLNVAELCVRLNLLCAIIAT